MKKYILILFLTLSFSARSQKNSVLSDGVWYKIEVSKTGVFKIDKNFLTSLGIDTSAINPKNIKIYGNGGVMLPEKVSDFRYKGLQENAIFVSGENDNHFNDNDYILFYGKGPHHWNVKNTPKHHQNIYSDKTYYFLSVTNSRGKRISIAPEIKTNSSQTIRTYNHFVFHEVEKINLFSLGRLWFGENFNIENTKTLSIPFVNSLEGSEITLNVAGVAISSLPSEMKIKVNNSYVGTINYSGLNSNLAIYGATTLKIPAANNLNIQVIYNNLGNPSAKAFLDYIEVIGVKKLIASNSQFEFRNFATKNTNAVVKYQIKNKNNIHQIWNVTDFINPKIITNQSNTNNFTFKSKGGTLQEFIVLNSKDFYTPKIVGKLVNQNLHALRDVEYLVITNKSLKSQAKRLADYHQINSNLTSKVVEVNHIFNEFSSGSPDIVGIRDFIKYENDKSNKKIKYVCFFGDTSYDYKNRIDGNNNIVPSYHAEESFNLVSSYVTDDFFVMISDEDGTMSKQTRIDIPSGRIPVSTVFEAKKVVDKILSYYSKKAFGDWRNTVTLISDDIDKNGDGTMQLGLEKIADTIKKHKPFFNINKIYADAYKQETSSGGEQYPQVKKAITNAVKKGSLVFNYFGHGGEDGWASEHFLDIPQIQTFSNINRLPLFITVTCEFSRFDNPLRDTAGERLFINPNGGAVSMVTTTRAIYISVGEHFNALLSRYVLDFNGSNHSIAENLMKTKNETSSIQKYFIYFFGDPAMKLAIPKPNIILSKINDVSISDAMEQFKALSKMKIEGIVTGKNNTILSNFNGVLSTTVFDKQIEKRTLDNDNQGIVNVFDSQESKVFNGKASVKNGMFSFEFVVPKDIKIAKGNGKISMYAENQKIDRIGANFDIIVGGINENALADIQGPEIKAFLDSDSFIDGGDTTTSPNLILKLEDANGINTSITSVDHDIVAVLDGNQGESIILNDYYETKLDDFTKGEVTYKFQDLKPGVHTLKIKAWDTYNNSSEITLTFNVVNSSLQLENVLNYPNPFVNYTEFWFTHNCPNQNLQVQIQVFTISGKLIKTINRKIQTSERLSRDISWDGRDDFGNKLGKGVYVYKLKVISNNLTAEKYEKLVIL